MSTPEIEKLVEDYRACVIVHGKVGTDDDLDDKWSARENAAKSAVLAAFERVERERDEFQLRHQGLAQKCGDLEAKNGMLQRENAGLRERVKELTTLRQVPPFGENTAGSGPPTKLVIKSNHTAGEDAG